MARIRINIADSLVSESAAKKPSYKVTKIGGAQTLVIPSDKKSDLQEIVASLKAGKKYAVEGLNARIKAATAFTKANQTPKGPRKTALKETYKTEKAKSATLVRQAKVAIRVANTIAKKVGLGGLNLPLSASDIVSTGPGLVKSLKTIRAVKLTEFGVTGKRGTFKPKFLKPETFEQISEKGKAGDYSKKPSQAAGIKRAKARIADKSPISKKSGQSLDEIEAELIARDKAKAKAKKAKAKKPNGVSGAAPGKRIDSYADAKVKSAITRFIKKPDADMSQLTDEELIYAHNSLLAKRESRANLGYGKKAGTLYNTDARKRVEAELARRKK